MEILALLRAPQFSPNSQTADRAIMMAVVERLRSRGHRVSVMGEGDVVARRDEFFARFDCALQMSRTPEAIAAVGAVERAINACSALERCRRSVIEATARAIGVPTAPDDGPDGYWLKRGDAAAQTRDDVVFCADRADVARRKAQFAARGVTDVVVSAHVAGDLVKFYGVRGTGFFRCFYPTDDMQTKFGDERRNGPARHYGFSLRQMHTEAERLADATGIDVYGGDCIVKADGTFCLIDFNDWPSFSRCRDEAAQAIASLVDNR